MSVIVLVHGGGGGAWCWEPLMSCLEVPALAVDLPGRGRRPLPLDQATSEIWADSVVNDIVRNDLHDVVLVGHSMGGLTILRVAARIPDRLKRLVFVASPVPEAGRSLADLMAEVFNPEKSGSLDEGVPREVAAELFAHDLGSDRKRWLLERSCPDSTVAYTTPVDLAALSGPVPRTYVRTARDRACPPAIQDRSIAVLYPIEVVEIDTGHSVMVSAPQLLATALHAVS